MFNNRRHDFRQTNYNISIHLVFIFGWSGLWSKISNRTNVSMSMSTSPESERHPASNYGIRPDHPDIPTCLPRSRYPFHKIHSVDILGCI